MSISAAASAGPDQTALLRLLEENLAATRLLRDRLQDGGLAALVLERLSISTAASAGPDQTALLRLLEDNLAATRLLRDRLQDGGLAALVLERIQPKPAAGNGRGEADARTIPPAR